MGRYVAASRSINNLMMYRGNVMNTIRVELFNKYTDLSAELRYLHAILQNDIEVSREEIQDWIERSNEVRNKLAALQQRTLAYLRGEKR